MTSLGAEPCFFEIYERFDLLCVYACLLGFVIVVFLHFYKSSSGYKRWYKQVTMR